MNRIEIVREYIDGILVTMKDIEERRAAYVHLYGVAQACALISMKRGMNTELAIMAGMLHDLYSYAQIDSTDHAHKGAVLAREILESLKITGDDENNIICDAIFTHSDKDTEHSEFDEVLKDADVFQHILYNPALQISEPVMLNRYERLKNEFGI